jgi:hypothetical protein
MKEHVASPLASTIDLCDEQLGPVRLSEAEHASVGVENLR